MHSSVWLVAIVIGLAVVAVVVARRVGKWSIISGREPICLEEMHQQYAEACEVSYELFEKTFSALGQAYRVDPKLLRPFDELKKLYDLDSWELGGGTEMLNESLEKNFGITRLEIEPRTIAELITEIEKQSKK